MRNGLSVKDRANSHIQISVLRLEYIQLSGQRQRRVAGTSDSCESYFGQSSETFRAAVWGLDNEL